VSKRIHVIASLDLDFRKNGEWDCGGGKSGMRLTGLRWLEDRGIRTGLPGLAPKNSVGIGGTGGGVPGRPGLGGGDRGRERERGCVVEMGAGRRLWLR